MPVAETFSGYAQEVEQTLKSLGLRVTVDGSDDSLNKKVRNAEKQKIPYILVVGEKEQTDKTVNVRSYKDKSQQEKDLTAFSSQLLAEYTNKSL